MTTGSTVRNTLKWTSAFLLWQDTGHKRHPRSLPPIGHHPFWRILWFSQIIVLLKINRWAINSRRNSASAEDFVLFAVISYIKNLKGVPVHYKWNAVNARRLWGLIWRSDAGDFPVILTNTGALHPEYGLFAPSNGPLPQGNEWNALQIAGQQLIERFSLKIPQLAVVRLFF